MGTVSGVFPGKVVEEVVKKAHDAVYVSQKYNYYKDKDTLFHTFIENSLAEYAVHHELKKIYDHVSNPGNVTVMDPYTRINGYKALIKCGKWYHNFMLFKNDHKKVDIDFEEVGFPLETRTEFAVFVRLREDDPDDRQEKIPVSQKTAYECSKTWTYDIPGFVTYPDMEYVIKDASVYGFRSGFIIPKGAYIGDVVPWLNTFSGLTYIQSGELRELWEMKSILDQAAGHGRKIDWSRINDSENEK